MSVFFTYLSAVSPITGIVLLIWTRSKGRQISKSIQLIGILLICSLTADLMLVIVGRLLKQPNGYVAHLYGLAEVILLILFFRKETGKSDFLLTLMLFFSVFYLVDSFYITGLLAFNTYSSSLAAVIMIGLSIYYLYIVYQQEIDIFHQKQAEFIVVVAVLLYFSAALFSFMLASDIFAHSNNDFYGSWIIHNSANIIKNILFAVAIYKAR